MLRYILSWWCPDTHWYLAGLAKCHNFLRSRLLRCAIMPMHHATPEFAHLTNTPLDPLFWSRDDLGVNCAPYSPFSAIVCRREPTIKAPSLGRHCLLYKMAMSRRNPSSFAFFSVCSILSRHHPSVFPLVIDYSLMWACVMCLPIPSRCGLWWIITMGVFVSTPMQATPLL